MPADLRLARVNALRIDEAMLTGEAVPAEKSLEAVAANTPSDDRAGMAFSGTLATSGQGAGIVVATGARTEIGKISAMLGSLEDFTTHSPAADAGFRPPADVRGPLANLWGASLVRM